MNEHGYLPLLVFASVALGACLGWLTRGLGVPWQLRQEHAAGWEAGREAGKMSAIQGDLWRDKSYRYGYERGYRRGQLDLYARIHEPRVVRQAQDVVRARWQ